MLWTRNGICVRVWLQAAMETSAKKWGNAEQVVQDWEKKKTNWEWRYSICIKRPSSLADQIVQLSAFKWLFSGILLAMGRSFFPWKKIFFSLQPPTETKGEPIPRSVVAIPNRTSFATVEKCKVFPHLCINPEQFPSHFQMVPIKSKNPCPNGC